MEILDLKSGTATHYRHYWLAYICIEDTKEERVKFTLISDFYHGMLNEVRKKLLYKLVTLKPNNS